MKVQLHSAGDASPLHAAALENARAVPGADCVAPPSPIPDMLGRRHADRPGPARRGLCAVGWRGAPRRLGATPDFHHGLTLVGPGHQKADFSPALRSRMHSARTAQTHLSNVFDVRERRRLCSSLTRDVPGGTERSRARPTARSATHCWRRFGPHHHHRGGSRHGRPRPTGSSIGTRWAALCCAPACAAKARTVLSGPFHKWTTKQSERLDVYRVIRCESAPAFGRVRICANGCDMHARVELSVSPAVLTGL
jgi:hypothetical protein